MRRLVKLVAPALALSLMLAACAGSTPSKATSSASTASEPVAQTSGPSGTVVKTISNPALGTILSNRQGITLYHLSGERNGKFICTSAACLSVWHPLLAPSSGAPSASGVSSLGTVKRSDGLTQVTYQGAPLYTFAQDKRAGETNGQGIKDVGTWSAAKIGSTAVAPSTTKVTQPAGKPESSGGGYAY